MWDSFAMAEGREEEASGALFHQIPYPFHTFGATGRRRLRLEPATEDDGTNSKEKPNGSECEVGICRWASAGENCDTQVPEKKVGASGMFAYSAIETESNFRNIFETDILDHVSLWGSFASR
ncbi:hypothetical protein F2P56_024797 [Juglans regia]|uniref:Uncharacterized protein n=1 Tax=Juglans regia TaxID=51240 RepID=A0A833U7D1_JUGRE|nr:hypothetical protein F2P56_024797 [Juglans regia]